MADYPVLDGAGNVIVPFAVDPAYVQPDPYDYAADYPVLDGAGNVIIADALNTGGGVVTGDVAINFATAEDGAPPAAATGEPTIRETPAAATTVVLGTVLNGEYVASGVSVDGTTTATYTGHRCKEELKSDYAMVRFGDAFDVVALIAAGDVSLNAVTWCSLHIVFQAASWKIQYWASGSIFTLHEGTFTSVPFNTFRKVGWRIDGTNIYLLLPNGQEVGPYASAEATSRTNYCKIWEHYREVGGIPTSAFRSVAGYLFADPVAAGRTNLLAQRNNVADVAWSRVGIDVITPNQPDASGALVAEKVMEDASGADHIFYQSIAKTAAQKRYTFRVRCKSDRDWTALKAFNSGFGSGAQGFFNTAAPAVGTSVGPFTERAYMAYDLGNGYIEALMTFKSDADAGLQVIAALASADNVGSYAGDISKGMITYDQWLFERPL